jgi:hypothetical protein
VKARRRIQCCESHFGKIQSQPPQFSLTVINEAGTVQNPGNSPFRHAMSPLAGMPV